MSMSDEPRPGTVSSLDRRVERLEGEFSGIRTDFATLSGEVGLVKQEQQHLRELMNTHFNSIEHAIAATLSETKLLSSRWDNAMTTGQSMMTDPTATPAGKMIMDRIMAMDEAKQSAHSELKARLATAESELDAVQQERIIEKATVNTLKWVFGGTSLVGAIMGLIGLLAALGVVH